MKMLRWHIGVQTGFARNPGKLGKYLQHYLEPNLWDSLLKTYADADYDALGRLYLPRASYSEGSLCRWQSISGLSIPQTTTGA